MFTPALNTVIPAVDPSDLKSYLKVKREAAKKGAAAIGIEIFREACSPGADLDALHMRSFWLAVKERDGDLSEFVHAGEVEDRVLELFAKFPFRVVKRDARPELSDEHE